MWDLVASSQRHSVDWLEVSEAHELGRMQRTRASNDVGTIVHFLGKGLSSIDTEGSNCNSCGCEYFVGWKMVVCVALTRYYQTARTSVHLSV
jgi:hypothetical protein